jgi:ribosomal-protein-alanine N-acetyltransferase
MHELETSRLRLRQFTMDDLDELARLFADPDVVRYLGKEGKPIPREETEVALASIIAHWERHGHGRWAVVHKADEGLIGCAGLRSHEGVPELVYLLDKPYWGAGLATEIARACLRFGFEELGSELIVAFVRPLNRASHRVLGKVGMREKGETECYGIHVVEYTLSKRDYRPEGSPYKLLSATPAARVPNLS